MEKKGLFLALMIITLTANRAFSQTVDASVYLRSLPTIELDKSQTRSYHISHDNLLS